MPPNSFFNDSPTAVLSPTAPSQYFPNGHYIDQQSSNAPVFNGISPNGLASSNAFVANSNMNDSAPPPAPLAGRKRSRGDIFSQADDGDHEDITADGSTITATSAEMKKPRGKPIYGPGMTLIYPEDPGYDMRVESQSGTWVEEGAERKAVAHPERPSVSSRKSQRMDSRASGPDDLAQLVLPPTLREVTQEPLIDEATRRLGISWARMDSSEARQISQKAYAKWIQNHYPALKDVAVWSENSSIPGYLVAAASAYDGITSYYIFSDDLTEARLITQEPSQLIPRLQMLPALHLAAPGGCIRAERDSITAAQNEVDVALVDGGMTDDSSSKPTGCAAHAMELD